VRDALAKLNSLGTDAVGVSPDAAAVQKKFSDKLSLNFPLLSDADHKVAEAYGVWGEKSLYGKEYFGVIRSAFLIDGNGRFIETWPKISPDETVPNVLAALEARQ
jgi:thioredoxin-dependent peroxiredoxin